MGLCAIAERRTKFHLHISMVRHIQRDATLLVGSDKHQQN